MISFDCIPSRYRSPVIPIGANAGPCKQTRKAIQTKMIMCNQLLFMKRLYDILNLTISQRNKVSNCFPFVKRTQCLPNPN